MPISIEEQLNIIESQASIVYYNGIQRIYSFHERFIQQSFGTIVEPLSIPSSIRSLRVFPCHYEAEIVEACPFNNPMKDIHHCLYEEHEFDRSMRGEVSPQKQKEVQSCLTCEHYKEPL